MKKTLNIISAALLVSSTALASAAFAQTASPAPATPGMDAPAATTPNATGAQTAPGTNTVKPLANDSAAATGGAYLTEQSQTQMSANEYIGQPVYNGANESIGEINDLIIEDNGGVVAAIVGVGGFLGLGEKNVAVPMEKITATQDTQSNELRLTTAETAESLQAAPAFKTLDQQAAEANTTVAPGTDATTTSSTVGK